MALPRPAKGTGKWWALGILVTLAFAGWLAVREYSVAGQRVTAQTLGFQVVDARTVTIDFEVSKPPEVTVVCTLQAQDIRHAVVGSATMTVPPADQRSTQHQATIRTTTAAVAALVHDCVRA
ncbi:MAG: DUF4307 domain-containing protein [Dermatophilaceae bacterium]